MGHAHRLILRRHVGQPEKGRALRPVGEAANACVARGSRGNQRGAGCARQPADDVVRRIDRAAPERIEVRLLCIAWTMDDAERTGRRAEAHGFNPGVGQARDIAQRPCGAEKAALSRVAFGQADAFIVRVGRECLAIRVVAAADRAGADAVGCLADEAACRGHLIGKCVVRLHHRAVVCCMRDGAGAVVHKIEQLRRRSLAVEFGEEGNHAAAQTNTGKGLAGRVVQVHQRRRRRPRATGQDALEVSDRTDGHSRQCKPCVAHQ